MSESTTTADRTPQDFAIEFAEYMAKGAEALITAINADAEVRLRIAESDDVSDDDEHDAQATVSEMQRALQSDIYEFRKRRDRAASATAVTFQKRVQPWLLECFGAEIAADRVERNHRFLEEALELVQALGCTSSEAHQLVDYVYGRPVGEPAQEVGGVMVTLAALCLASGLDMHQAGETELARISAPDLVAKIRAKQAAKPKHSPLPMATQQAPAKAAEVQADWLRRFSQHTIAPTLKAMSQNYSTEHCWDALDSKACAQGASEIETLLTRLSESMDGPMLIEWEQAHRVAFQAAAAFRPPYFGIGFRAHNWVVEAIRSAHMDGQLHARGLPPIDRVSTTLEAAP